MPVNMILLMPGGPGMFLYGMKMMPDGLESVADDRMRRVLEFLTTNRFAAVGIGTGVTVPERVLDYVHNIARPLESA